MVYGLVSLVTRTCCIFYYLKLVEINPGFSVSCYHSPEIRVYAYIQFNPVSYVWEELFCYCCLRTIFPFFLPFLCNFFCFALQRILWNPVEGDRSVSVTRCSFCQLISQFISVDSYVGLDPREFCCLIGSFQNIYPLPNIFDEVTVVVDVLYESIVILLSVNIPIVRGLFSAISNFYFSRRYNPHWGLYFTALQWALASSLARFLDHTQRRATVGRTPLNE